MCIIDCLSTIVFILPLHLDYTKVIILILWWRNFQLEYWRTFQLVSTLHDFGESTQIVFVLHNSSKINDKTSFYYVYVLFLFHKTGCISAIQVNLIAFDLHCFCLDTKEKDTKKKKSRLHFLATPLRNFRGQKELAPLKQLFVLIRKSLRSALRCENEVGMPCG